MKKNDVKTVCLFCGKGKDNSPIVKVRDMKNIPQRVMVDYEPCAECKKEWDKGIPLIEVTTEPTHKGQPPISDGVNVYPTGRFIVLSEGALNEDYKVGVPTLCLKEDYETILRDLKKLISEGNQNGQQTK